VGGGIIGLSVARELLKRRPGASLTVLEREAELGRHQTGHNSGVIHAGIYYAPGSLKAKLCLAGMRELYEYCDERGIEAERCGKVIVALDKSELPRLDELERRGRANNVPGLRRIGRQELREIEPHAAGVEALHSPETGIVDFAAVAREYANDVRAAGATVTLGAAVAAIDQRAGRIVLTHRNGEISARFAVFCAGLWSDRLAVLAGADPDPRVVPFRGAYLRLKPQAKKLVNALIYPIPDPALPFLGVHLTKHVDQEILVGPTALIAPGRASYKLSQVNAKDLMDTLAWPGTYRMAHEFWRTGLTEIHHALSKRALANDAARYVPELTADDVERAFAGIRAQALAKDGRLVDDFVVSETERAIHIRNAPSPAATSSLAIARLIADRVEQAAGADLGAAA
jgi:2-hydroxyglutarate dehydrogenase